MICLFKQKTVRTNAVPQRNASKAKQENRRVVPQDGRREDSTAQIRPEKRWNHPASAGGTARWHSANAACACVRIEDQNCRQNQRGKQPGPSRKWSPFLPVINGRFAVVTVAGSARHTAVTPAKRRIMRYTQAHSTAAIENMFDNRQRIARAARIQPNQQNRQAEPNQKVGLACRHRR